MHALISLRLAYRPAQFPFPLDESNYVRSLVIPLFVCSPEFIGAIAVVIMEVGIDVGALEITLNILFAKLVGPSLILQRRDGDFACDRIEGFRGIGQKRIDQLQMNFICHRKVVKRVRQ